MVARQGGEVLQSDGRIGIFAIYAHSNEIVLDANKRPEEPGGGETVCPGDESLRRFTATYEQPKSVDSGAAPSHDACFASGETGLCIDASTIFRRKVSR